MACVLRRFAVSRWPNGLSRRTLRWPYFRGVALQLDGADAEAVSPLRRAALLCPRTPDAPLLRLAEALLKQNQLDEAERHFRELVAQNANSPRAHLGLARLALTRGDLEAARDSLRLCLKNSASRKAAHQLLAEVEQRQDDPEAARRALRQAASFPPDAPWPDPFQDEIEELKVDRPTRIRHVQELSRRGKDEEADLLLNRLERDHPGTYPLLEGRRRLEARDFKAAEQAFREAVRLAPDFAQAHFWLGVALREQKDVKNAAASFRAAVRLQPRHAAAYERLGLCLEDLGDRSGAIAALRAAADYLPQKAEVHRRLGILLAGEGLHAEALTHLRRALSLNPDDAKSREWIDRLQKHRDHKPAP